MFKKIIIFFGVISLILGILVGVAFYRVANYDNSQEFFSLDISQQEKTMIKEIAKEIKSWIYYEATIHNPAGDVLPDEIDDKIIEEIKSRIK